jgi:addiction module RelE/StbE family toxin
MNYKIQISEKAERDLKDIVTYLSDSLKNKRAAKDFTSLYRKKINSLKTNPQKFTYIQEEEKSDFDYRKIIIKNYLVIYKIEKEEVIILRIFHQKQKYFDLL